VKWYFLAKSWRRNGENAPQKQAFRTEKYSVGAISRNVNCDMALKRENTNSDDCTQSNIKNRQKIS